MYIAGAWTRCTGRVSVILYLTENAQEFIFVHIRKKKKRKKREITPSDKKKMAVPLFF